MGLQIAGFTVANIAEVESSTANAGITVPAPKALRTILYDANGQRVPVGFDQNSAADRETFGAAVIGHRSSMITADWALAFAANAVTLTVTGGGTGTQSNGLALLTSGVAVTASVFVQSKQRIAYQPGREIYCMFTAAFTTPTSASTFQRAGIYDTNNGFYIGYFGTTFGISSRTAAINTDTAKAAFNVDTLAGATGSLFTRNGTPEALDPTKENVYRIRFGWLGAATITFQVMAPDGNWVTFHKILAPNISATPFIQNPNLPMTMEVSKTGADATSLVLGTSSWDAGVVASNSLSNGGAIVTAAVSGVPMIGLDGGQITRVARVGEFGTQRTTSEIQIWQDAFEVATINAFWTQSLTTMTAVQAAGILTLNNASITTLNTNAIITSQRLFPKYPRQPLYGRWRALVSANVAANQTLVELGFGIATGVTAAVTNGAFFRWTAAGNLIGVLSYGATEVVTGTLIAQGDARFSTANYFYYDVIVDDDFVRFIMSDSAGVPIVDTQLPIATTSAFTISTSHMASFARVYVTPTGGGTAIQLKLSAHVVQILDGVMNKTWEDQSAASMRSASINPSTYVQTQNLANAAVSAAVTPTNTTVTNANLGGEYNCLATVGAETILSVFGFTVPSPYSFYLKGLIISAPVVQVVAVVTAALLEWFIAPNASTANLSTATGLQRIPMPGWHTAAAAAAVGVVFSGGNIVWTPKVPILCLPGTILHIGYKSVTGAATATLAYRGQVTVDGHFE